MFSVKSAAGVADMAAASAEAVVVEDRAEARNGAAAPKRRLEDLQWENTFVEELPGDPQRDGPVRQVRNACYSLVAPSVNLTDGKLVAYSEEVAAMLGLDPAEFERPEFVAIFGGASVPKGCKSYAQCYGGHQFGQWAGQLGDGRAITLGEVVGGGNGGGDPSAAPRLEVQLKGAGRTPYSRHADGRAVLRSSVREFLASEAMHHLGVPTTRALSLVTTGEDVMRDMFYNGDAKMEPGAVVCRVAPSFLRFGSYQLPASRGGIEKGLARALADYAIRHHFPHLAHLPAPEPGSLPPLANAPERGGAGEGREEKEEAQVDVAANRYTAWFAEVAESTGRLVAAWQAVGFTHGVLNTDNMSILGLTIDYGPYGFLDKFDPRYTPNTTDLPGRRYCFENQPSIGMWNVVQLANALLTADLMTVEEGQHCVSRYAETFVKEFELRMRQKLGLQEYNKGLTQDVLRLMAADGVDFTNLFRALSSVQASAPQEAQDADILRPLSDVLGDLNKERRAAWGSWVQKYAEQLTAEGSDDAKRKQQMDSMNPCYILRNYLCQVAIESAEAGDYSELRQLMDVLKRPYESQPGMERYAAPPPEWAARPGVCMLSCSS